MMTWLKSKSSIGLDFPPMYPKNTSEKKGYYYVLLTVSHNQYYHVKHCTLLYSWCCLQLALLEHKWEAEAEEDEYQSHNKPITAALYNDLFNQVVSASHDSVVSVWDLATGTKTIQFSNAHRYMEKGVEKFAEITAMTFDPTGRRLVTGGRNGTVKIWNFNNGAMLRELDTFDNLEVNNLPSV